MSNQKHVENAVALYATLATIAERHEAHAVVESLETAARVVIDALRIVEQRRIDTIRLRDERARTLRHLGDVFFATTHMAAVVLGPDHPVTVAGGQRLSVVERARFRMRALERRDDDARSALLREEQKLTAALSAYEDCVDALIEARADGERAQSVSHRGSQTLRVEMERARAELLLVLPSSSPDARRLRGLTLRTRRPQWREARLIANELHEQAAASLN